MQWNHRIVRMLDYISDSGEAHYTLGFAEVYYNDDGTPAGYTEPYMHGDDLGELRQLVNRLGDAINKDILDERDMRHKHVPDSNEEIDAVMNKRIGWLPGDECPLCGKSETCEECK